MSFFTQIFSVAWLSVRTIRQRLGSSAVAVVGIAGVVIVFVAVLSIAEGFQAAMKNAGQPDRALIMRGGASDEMSSGLEGESAEVIKQAPGIRRENNQPLASTELYVIVDLPKRSTMTAANVPLRGITPVTPQVRYDARIVQGRMLTFGTNEIVAGRAAAATFAGLSVGSIVKTGAVAWTVVGIFEAGGSVAETEIWADARVVQGAFRRDNSYQSVLVRLESPEAFKTMKNWLTTNPQLSVDVHDESQYYSEHSQTLTGLIQLGRLRDRRADGIRRGVRRDPDHVHGRLDPHARDRDAARARLQHGVGRRLGAGGIAGARRAGRRGRRAARLPRVQRLPDVDDELPDLQPGRLRLRRHAGAAAAGADVRAHHGVHRQPCCRR